MTKKLITLLQEQINKELYSAYAYYAVGEFYRQKGLNGFHTYFHNHANEEMTHADKFSEFLQDNDIDVVFKDIEALNKKFKDIREPLAFFVDHEKQVTASIDTLYKAARSEDDLAAMNFLDDFVTEQREEEKISSDLLQKYDLFAKDNSLGLYQLDKELNN